MSDANRRRDISNTSATAVGATAAEPALKVVAETLVHNGRAVEANAVLQRAEAAINAIPKHCGDIGDARLAGRIAEVAHAENFNADAIMKGRPELKAELSPDYHDPIDIRVKENGVVRQNIQSKYCSNPTDTANSLAYSKYDGQQKVVPADQLSGVKQEAARRAAKNLQRKPELAKAHQDTVKNATDRIRHRDVEGKPLPREDALKLAKEAKRGRARLDRVERRPVALPIEKAIQQAATNAAAFSAATTAVVSGVQNIQAYRRGEVTGKDAVVSTLKETGVSAVDAAVKAGAGAALKAGATVVAKQAGQQALRGVAGTLAGSNVVFSLAAVGVDTVAGAAQLAAGSIDGAQYARKVGGSASSAAGGFAGMKAGAALGTLICPGPGTIVGGVVGGVLGGIGAGQLFRRLVRR
jgi:hypothetical protein